ncbi:MAG: hypothetical protein AAGH89_08550 [Verrucomicrobiota bacterium]
MPVEVSVDQDRNLIFLTIAGKLAMGNVDGLFEGVAEQLPEGEGEIDFLVDCSEAVPNEFTMTEMDSIAKRVSRLSWSSRVRREALVANQKNVLGLLKLYAQFSDGDRDIRIFRCRETAESWLEEPV